MERNACVDCNYFSNYFSGNAICEHPAHRDTYFNRIFGERAVQKMCEDVRREQPTDACPHWEAKQ